MTAEKIKKEQISTKTPRKPKKLAQKTLTAIKMLDNGVDPKTALQLVNNKHQIHPQTINNLKNTYKKYSLTHPKTVKLAQNAITEILQGKGVEVTKTKIGDDGQLIEYTEETAIPTASNRIAAASLVYDRFEPAIQRTESVNINIDPVDLAKYRNNELSTNSYIDASN